MFNSKCQYIFFAILLLIVAIPKVESLTCYTCSTELSRDCKDPFNLERYDLTAECNNPQEVCVKHKITNNLYSHPAQREIQRGCRHVDYCRNYVGTEYENDCLICYSNLCNSSITIRSSIITSIISLVLSKLIWKFI